MHKDNLPFLAYIFLTIVFLLGFVYIAGVALQLTHP